MTDHHWPAICFGSSAGFSFTAIVSALAHMSAESWLAALASAVSTAAGWHIARRAEAARVAHERALVDALVALRSPLPAPPAPPPPPA